MRKTLILKAFEKAKDTIHSEVVSQLSTHISDTILQEYKYLVNERTFRNYYKQATESTDADIHISRPNELYLSKYLGYGNYADFLAKNGLAHQKNKMPRNIIILLAPVIVLFMGYFFYDNSKKDCMLWTHNDHYEKVSCEVKGDIDSEALDPHLLERFKRVDPDCDYPFFKMDGSANLWYEKDANGILEYFTYYGLHPITGKTLKPITEYMVKTHICDSLY